MMEYIAVGLYEGQVLVEAENVDGTGSDVSFRSIGINHKLILSLSRSLSLLVLFSRHSTPAQYMVHFGIPRTWSWGDTTLSFN